MEGNAIDIVSTIAGAGFTDAAQTIQRQNLKPVEQNGISTYAGEDRGVPFRFFIHTYRNEEKSRREGYRISDEVECIEWLKSKYSRPTAMLRPGHIPTELLDFEEWSIPFEVEYDANGFEVATKENRALKNEYFQKLRELRPVGGLLFEAYTRWKEGRDAPGTALERWDAVQLGEGDIATLKDNGVYTVEMLAAVSPDKLRKWPDHYREIQEQSVEWLNKQEYMQRTQEEIAKLGDLKGLLEKYEARNAELEAKLLSVESEEKVSAKTTKGKK